MGKQSKAVKRAWRASRDHGRDWQCSLRVWARFAPSAVVDGWALAKGIRLYRGQPF